MMSQKKSFAQVIVALGGLFLLTGCGQSQAKGTPKDQPLHVMLPSEPMTADPNKSADTNSSSVIRQVMEGLYAFDKNNKVVPGVAKKIVKPTNDGKRYTIDLKKSAKWANGQPVTANDFVYSFRRIADPKTSAQNVSAYDNIQNFEAVQNKELPPSAVGIKALGKHRLQIDFARKTPWFNYLAATAYYPLNQKTVEKYGKEYGTSSQKLMTNGAYQLKGWKGTNNSWTYQKNPRYWNANKVKINKVVVKVTKEQNTAANLFQTKKLDEATLTGQYVKGHANDSALRHRMFGRMTYLTFNSEAKETSSENLRQAFSYVINRQTIAKNVLQDGSKPAKNLIPQGDQKNPQTHQDMAQDLGNLVPTDVKKAQSYWKKYLAEQGKKQVTLDLLVDDTDEDKHVGTYIQSAAEKNFPGLKVTVSSLPHAQHVSRSFDKKYQINLLGWTTRWLDSADFLSLAAADKPINFTNWKDQPFNASLQKAAQTDGQARYDNLVKANRRLMEVKGLVPLYQPAEGKLVNPKLGGIKYGLVTDVQYKHAYWK